METRIGDAKSTPEVAESWAVVRFQEAAGFSCRLLPALVCDKKFTIVSFFLSQ